MKANPKLVNHPTRLFAMTLLSIFLSECIVMLFLVALPPLSTFLAALLDATLLTLMLFPLFIFLIHRPHQSYIADRARAEEELRESEQRFSDIAEHALEWLWEVDSEGKYTYASPVIEKILGYQPEEIVDKHFYDLFHPEDREQLKTEAFRVFATKQPFSEFINRNVHKRGHIVWLSTSGIPILNAAGELIGYRGADTDITNRKHAEDKLQESERRFKDVAANTGDWIWETDDEGKYTYSSPVVENILGFKPEEVIGRYFFDFLHPDNRTEITEAVLDVFSRREAFQNVSNNKVHKSGRIVICESSGVPVFCTSGKLRGYRGAVRDVTERKNMERKLRESAITDELTGLLNRRGFYALSDQQRKISDRNGKGMSFLFADVDDLKSINDEFGHEAGDRALSDIANMLQCVFRKSDVIGRIGGDEFVVLLTDTWELNIENIITAHVRKNLEFLNRQADRRYELSLSMGFARYDPKHPCTISELQAQADRSMYGQKYHKKVL